MSSPYDEYRFKPLTNPRENWDKDREKGPHAFLQSFQPSPDWQIDRLMDHGRLLRPVKNATSRHWFGGPLSHSGAVCPLCTHPLRMLLNLDLQADDTPPILQREFAPLTRLPLMYCFRCPPGTIYRVLSDNRVQMIRPWAQENYSPETDGCEETPFFHFENEIPKELPHRPAELIPIPSEIHRGLASAEDGYWEKRQTNAFSPEETVALEWLQIGPPFYELMRSQLCGIPLTWQDSWWSVCPNPQCPLTYAAAQEDWPGYREECLMRPLALFYDDSSQGLFDWKSTCATIEFQVCPCCLTIQSQYGCD